jgi:hypothetical protein
MKRKKDRVAWFAGTMFVIGLISTFIVVCIAAAAICRLILPFIIRQWTE